MLIWSSTFLGFVIVVSTIWILVNRYWLTPGEREAGRTALAQIETLEKLQIGGADESVDLDGLLKYDTTEQRAESAVSAAEMKAWTIRDRQLAGTLSGYLWEIENFTRTDFLIERILSDSNGKISPRQLMNIRKFKQKERSTQSQLYSFFRSALQKQLE